MTPEYLEELAERADPEQLWRRRGMDHHLFTPEQKKSMDTAVALRRYASHIEELRDIMGKRKSLLITPFTPNSSARKTIETPIDHKKLRDR